MVDVLACARCNGRMRVISVIEEPPVIEKIFTTWACHREAVSFNEEAS